MPPRPQRRCHCNRCSLHFGGFKIVSHSTFVRHNPIIHAANRIPPPPPFNLPARERTPSIRYGSLLPDLQAGSDGTEDDDDRMEDAQAQQDETESVAMDAERRDREEALMNNRDNEDYPAGDGIDQEEEEEEEEEEERLSENHGEGDQDEEEEEEEEDDVEVYRERDDGIIHNPNQLPIVSNPNKHHSLSPSTRLLFTQAAVSKATGSTKEQCNIQLEQGTQLYEVATGGELPSATNNIKTAQMRLGVHPDQYIDRYIVCPNLSCWNLTPYSQLSELETAVCGAELEEGGECVEEIYDVIARSRIPYKVVPYCRMSRSLALLLRDQEFVDNVGAWRDEADEDDAANNGVLPLDPDQLVYPLNTPLDHVCDGTAWRAAAAHVRRIVEEDNSVTEEVLPGRNIVRFSSLPFGMFAKVSVDWFAVKEVMNGSVGAIWITWGNLPADLVNKKRFTSLLSVIPGPKEPSKLLFNKVLDPMMEDIGLCEQGFFTAVQGYDELKFVQVRIHLNFSDMPATRKLLGSVSPRGLKETKGSDTTK